MRRTDREVTDFNEIADILHRAGTIRLGLHDEPYPYVVPLSFGYETKDGKITIYIHGAKEGLKNNLISKNPHVCVQTDILHHFKQTPKSFSAEYESFTGFGIAERISGSEAKRAIDLMVAQCGFEGIGYDEALLEVTAVYKINLSSFTSKRNTKI